MIVVLIEMSGRLMEAEEAGVTFVEGPPNLPFLHHIDEATLIVEACFSARARGAVLYAPNLTEKFFDLSSGEAGAILQKLRTYRIRLAVVCEPGQVQSSRMFGELMIEENRSDHLRIFESAPPAREWLTGYPRTQR